MADHPSRKNLLGAGYCIPCLEKLLGIDPPWQQMYALPLKQFRVDAAIYEERLLGCGRMSIFDICYGCAALRGSPL